MSEVTAIGEFECTDTTFVASFDNLLCDFYIFIVVNRYHPCTDDRIEYLHFIESCHDKIYDF